MILFQFLLSKSCDKARIALQINRHEDLSSRRCPELGSWAANKMVSEVWSYKSMKELELYLYGLIQNGILYIVDEIEPTKWAVEVDEVWHK